MNETMRRYVVTHLPLAGWFTSRFSHVKKSITKAKPNPEVFLLAAKQLGVDANNCVVFEDAVAGIQAANAAQMTSIGIGDKNVLNEAQFNFTDFTQISTDFIKNLIEN